MSARSVPQQVRHTPGSWTHDAAASRHTCCSSPARLPLSPHLQLSLLVADDDDAQVVGEEVHAVVAGHSDRDLELAGQELRAVDGLRGVLEVGAEAVEGAVVRDLGVLEGAGGGSSRGW
jgi:hypothetical protein